MKNNLELSQYYKQTLSLSNWKLRLNSTDLNLWIDFLDDKNEFRDFESKSEYFNLDNQELQFKKTLEFEWFELLCEITNQKDKQKLENFLNNINFKKQKRVLKRSNWVSSLVYIKVWNPKEMYWSSKKIKELIDKILLK